MDIASIFKQDRVSGDVGIEIEVEGENLPSIGFPWRMESDGSLKGSGAGVEYVLGMPVEKSTLPDVISNFSGRFNNSVVYNSIYAGIHVHANIQHFTLRQLVNLLTCLFVLEEPMVRWCGKTRVGNHFCLRSCDAEWLIEFIRTMILTENPKLMVNNDSIRYAAFNLKAIPLHGSLEFRTLESTIDPERITIWANTILNIVEQSQTYDNPVQIVQDVKRLGPIGFMNKMMGQYAAHFYTADCDKLIKDGLIIAQEIAYVKDWNKSYNLNIFSQMKEVF